MLDEYSYSLSLSALSLSSLRVAVQLLNISIPRRKDDIIQLVVEDSSYQRLYFCNRLTSCSDLGMISVADYFRTRYGVPVSES